MQKQTINAKIDALTYKDIQNMYPGVNNTPSVILNNVCYFIQKNQLKLSKEEYTLIVKSGKPWVASGSVISQGKEEGAFMDNAKIFIVNLFKDALKNCLTEAHAATNPIALPDMQLSLLVIQEVNKPHFIKWLGIKIFDFILYLFGRETAYSHMLSNKTAIDDYNKECSQSNDLIEDYKQKMNDETKLEYYTGFNINTQSLLAFTQPKVQKNVPQYTVAKLQTAYNKCARQQPSIMEKSNEIKAYNDGKSHWVYKKQPALQIVR
jgi:hypothetical protein